MPELVAWGNFYLIVGGAGAALVGVQFVVITLIASARRRAHADTLHAFTTPTVVHLGAAMTVSALMTAPWHTLRGVSVALGACGLAGILYAVSVVRHTRRQTEYRPVPEDWLWYALLPLVLYAALLLAALRLRASTSGPLLVIASAGLGLLLVGIHNAWDTVTHIVTIGPGAADDRD